MNNLSPNTPFWLRNGHADTIFAKFLQRPSPAYRRELLPDSTGKTQVAYDFVDSPNPDAPLVVLFHGFGGRRRPLRKMRKDPIDSVRTPRDFRQGLIQTSPAMRPQVWSRR